MAGLVPAIHALLPELPRFVTAKRHGRDGERDGLRQRVGSGARLRLRRRGPVAEGEEADVFHGGWWTDLTSGGTGHHLYRYRRQKRQKPNPPSVPVGG